MTKPLYILGIHDGHNSSASIVADGVVVAAVQEERLTRRKNEVGYPRRAIEDCLRIAGIGAGELAQVVYASLFMHKTDYLLNIEPWYVTGLEHQRADATRPKQYEKVIFEQRKAERIADVVAHLGVAAERISFVEHHLAHLAGAYFTAPLGDHAGPVLGLTCDGAGDNIAGSVSICRGNDIERIATTDRHASLGKIYSRMTMLLGMTPWEHEYKLMGLAPYADPDHARKAEQKLRPLLRVDAEGLRFVQGGELSMNYCYEYLRDAFERTRFDTMSAAVQLFTEEMLVEWVRAAVRKTGIADLVCGGGVFMNVKANKAIAEMPEVRSLYVMPSAGDESLSIGAALHRHYMQTGSADRSASTFRNLYLGGDYGAADEKAAVAAQAGGGIFDVVESDDVDSRVVDLLASGEIVARCRGRMEFGARALGNRSILSDASDFRTVEKLNNKIKHRDFWMPFAPSIRAESAGRYMTDPKSLKPYFMMAAYEGSRDAARDLAAAMHPRDHTIRPQVVTAAANPGYHRIIGGFEQKTGRGGVLNTSFNLHGEPIVYTPAEAIDVFLRSGLDHLALDRHILSKRDVA
jgi:carbamoyltransferase